MKIIVAILFLLTGTASWADKRPNILFFLVDDMGIGDTSVPFLYPWQSSLRVVEFSRMHIPTRSVLQRASV